MRASETDGALLTIGNAYYGLTDAEIAEMTRWFRAHRTGSAHRVVDVKPKFSLRFARIVRLRLDKQANEIDTLANVEALACEGVDL